MVDKTMAEKAENTMIYLMIQTLHIASATRTLQKPGVKSYTSERHTVPCSTFDISHVTFAINPVISCLNVLSEVYAFKLIDLIFGT